MAKILPIALLVASLLASGCATRLKAGMHIDRSTAIRTGTCLLPAPHDPDIPVIRISGHDITVDFNGTILEGSPADSMPDSYRGVAVLIDGGRNITIRNLKARGYQVGLLARNVENLHIHDCDMSYNYKPRLKSTLAREDLSDWLSFHHNDNDEWLRYGAGIYIGACDHAQVTGCTVSGGQNGLMMTRCNDGKIWNNNFSFNSGVGLGLYRSSRNTVMHNRMDWCVRGYSHGVYHRGQDSAGILVYEQSCNNVFAWNSATHSGDGFFLWAGQTTMDSGQGGSNDNVIACNDFSFAPTNGIEVTFSRNLIHSNAIEGCDHGIWGGYSFETKIIQNWLRENRIGIAIEHGQDNLIAFNSFLAGKIGIKLWQNPKQDPNWGYPKFRDTRSRGYRILANHFMSVEREQDISNTLDVEVSTTAPADIPRIDLTSPLVPAPIDGTKLYPFPWGQGLPRGRKYILVDEWGSYDFKSPRLWPREKLPDGRQRFEILGPPGQWKIIRQDGVGSISPQSGPVPGGLIVAMSANELNLELEYVGVEVWSPFGRKTPAGQPYRFGYASTSTSPG